MGPDVGQCVCDSCSVCYQSYRSMGGMGNACGVSAGKQGTMVSYNVDQTGER
jgi:hypothetical protein